MPRLLSRRAVAVTGLRLLGLPAAALVYVTQPLGWHTAAAPLDGPDPRRLEAHVRMLAETCAPRHWKRMDNLSSTRSPALTTTPTATPRR